MSALTAADIIIRPVVSEKSIDESGRGKYTFAVHKDANKIQIKSAIEELYAKEKVTVVSVTDLTTTHEVELIDGKITWPDGSVATRGCHHVRQRIHNGNHLLDRLIVYGTAQGTFRNGRGYSIEILEELVYDRSCVDSGVFIAVQGKKLVKHGAREFTIDYGDGTCDNIVTLTNKSGLSVRYEVSK